MLRLESKILQREFVVHEGILYASQIRNVLSGRDFVPDGNSVEFVFRFTDGSEFSSKGLKVTDTKQKNGRLAFTFEETEGITVTVTFWAGEDGNTLKKQISFLQTSDKTIDCIVLEHIGIVNSETHFTSPESERYTLGQPFYIDSLFFGCEFPATQNEILFGIGQVRYWLGKKINGRHDCPVTVVGGAKSNLMVDVQKAFFDYIEDISVKSDIRIQYNTWFDRMHNIDADTVEKTFFEVEKGLTSNGLEPIDAYVVDDGWNDYKAPFWSFNRKFPNQMYDLSQLAGRLSSGFGLWLSPRGGYVFQEKFAKKLEKKGFGAYNSASKDICVADKTYLKNLKEFIVKSTLEFDIGYWKLDGFAVSPCANSSHKHAVGGDNDMYFYTDMWSSWIDIFTSVRELRRKAGKSLWINMTCFAHPSPWWLQYVNSIWLQNGGDIGFAENNEEQSRLDREITYRDTQYYELLNVNAAQLPLWSIYNHEPIYANLSKTRYTDEEFEKFLYFNACRGQALNELYISPNMMNKSKWRALASVLKWQKSNYDILRNARLIGGRPDGNNVYGYFSWNDNGDGIIALRNPTGDKTPVTLTLNRLMGCPEGLEDVNRYNVYCVSGKESYDSYSYADKLDLTLRPFEIRIYQFGKEDRRFDDNAGNTEFTVSFEYNGEPNAVIAENKDIKISTDKSFLNVRCGRCHLRSNSIITGGKHKITVVREKNKMLKIYIDRYLDASGFDGRAVAKINTDLTGSAEGFRIITKATPYDEIITLKEILQKVGKRKKKS
jgi:hypothetical protein